MCSKRNVITISHLIVCHWVRVASFGGPGVSDGQNVRKSIKCLIKFGEALLKQGNAYVFSVKSPVEQHHER